jgi:hypothetical protein
VGYAGGFLSVTQILLLYAASVVPWLLHPWWSRGVAPVRPVVDRALARAVAALGLSLHLGLISFSLRLRFDELLVNLYRDPAEVGVHRSRSRRRARLVADRSADAGDHPVLGRALGPRRDLARLYGRPLRVRTRSDAFGCLRGDPAVLPTSSLRRAVHRCVSRPAAAAPARDCRRVGAAAADARGHPARPPVLYSAALLAAFALNCVITVALIPALGINGASIASSVAYVALATALVVWTLRAGRLRARDVLLPTGAGCGHSPRRSLRFQGARGRSCLENAPTPAHVHPRCGRVPIR